MLDEEAIKQRVEEFTQDAAHYEAALRHIQIAVQACLDIGRHTIAAKSLERPKELKLSKATGVRNILVHSYLEVDPRKVYKIIQEDLPDLDKFVHEIGEYLKKEGGERDV